MIRRVGCDRFCETRRAEAGAGACRETEAEHRTMVDELEVGSRSARRADDPRLIQGGSLYAGRQDEVGDSGQPGDGLAQAFFFLSTGCKVGRSRVSVAAPARGEVSARRGQPAAGQGRWVRL